MNIENRDVKPENNKKIMLVVMYILLLRNGDVYDYEVGLDCSKPSDLRTFERYANELYRVGAIPKLRVQKKTSSDGKGRETCLYYYQSDEVKLRDLCEGIPIVNGYRGIDITKPLLENEYHKAHHFHYYKGNPSSHRLARVLAYIYFCQTNVRFVRLKNELTREENLYLKHLNPGASKKTMQRDFDLYQYATYYIYTDLERMKEKYRPYIKKIRKGSF